jgi:endonuclease G
LCETGFAIGQQLRGFRRFKPAPASGSIGVVNRTRILSAIAFLLALSAPALADTGSAPVIGGDDAPAGKWPDIAGMLFGGNSLDCSGVLIAPELVLTAGHCNDASLTQVVIGSASRSNFAGAEVIEVAERIEYPNSWNNYDITVVRLARPSTKTPRTIATGWARFDIKNGATVALVGFGAVNAEGWQSVDALQEAETTITDANCTTSPGCNGAVSPGGELGAGGGGIDTCPGDSGGPAYLVTDYGVFLAGITSRAYADATVACSEGGLYGRPDAIVGWIESETGITLPVGPMPTADVLVAPGGSGSVRIEPNDPHAGTTHTFTVVTQGDHGTAEVSADGVVTYRASTEGLGTDAITVEVADASDPSRAVSFQIDVEVTEDTGGCCSTQKGSPAGATALFALVGLGLLRRRRR